eukprot:TRINITY_DN2551_c0_g1_i1.p1 TRINITY_DN2551_c0_g1~~TRINITY_DN2551_c0_g1_i1.p1  ORF type:complete len:629 (+),score=43.50 TRINITY_DN2551_c0_g1_i1:137-2023(+)
MVLHQCGPFLSLRVFGALLCFLVGLQISCGSDVDILLQLKSDANVRFQTWNASNIENLCTNWEGIECDESGRVVVLFLSRVIDTPTILRGTIPPYIANLTALRILSLDNNDIWGIIPNELWRLANLSQITVTDTACTLQLPPRLPSKTTRFGAASARLLEPATLPDHDNWGLIDLLDLGQTNLRCPFPPTFVDYFVVQNRRIPNCRMSSTFLTVDENNMVCGQIPLAKFTCRLFPLAFLPPHFPNSEVTPVVQQRVEFKTHFLEFNGDEVFLFAAYRSRTSGAAKAYRGEYVHFKTFPVAEILNNTNAEEYIYNHNQSKWDSFILDSPSRIRANLSRVDDLIVEYIFEEKQDAADSLPYIKFSYQIYNLGHQWRFRAPNLGYVSNRTVSVSLTQNHKVAHSSPDGSSVMTCFGGTQRGNPFTNCTGPLATFKTEVIFGQLVFRITTQTNKTRMTYDYVLSIYSDDLNLADSSQASIEANRFPYPLPSGTWLSRLREAGGVANITNMPEQQQSMVLPVEFSFLPFVNRAVYDPDVSITLLFDPSTGDPMDPPQVITDVNNAITVGVIVAIVVVIVVVAVGLTVGAVFLFPYLARRKETAAELKVIDESETPADNRGSASWSKAQPRSAT